MEKIGKYQVLEKIGVGGFGVVYKGYDPFIKRFVAIKTCTSDEEEIRTRFFQEAEIAGNLQHRNIVTVYDFGLQDGVPYLVQEYLTGEDLDRKIKRRDGISQRERLLYLVQVARGLEYAHSKGVIHRDIKPANIRILEDGTAKIMDFGIAKLAQRQSGLTQTGMTLGTAAYLAPEQIRGEPIDPRTDIFSFGILAYELLSYERPFSGEVISTVLYQILNTKPKPVSAFWSDCPGELTAIVERCMAKEVGDRYPNCNDLLHDLDQALRTLRARSTTGEIPRQPSAALPTGELAAARTTAIPAADPSARSTTAELDLAYHLDSHRRTPRSISTQVYREREIPRGAWVAAIIALLVLVGIGWLYWQGSRPTAISTAPLAASSPSGPVTPPSSATHPTSSPRPTPSSTPATAAPAPPAVPSPAATPSPTPSPTPPEKGTLSVTAAWNPDMTVTVDGGPARRLDRTQNVQVNPGEHLLIFELVESDYSDRMEVPVSVKPGKTQRIDVPIPRAGRLTVQVVPGSPIGLVTLDGESLGPVPIRNRPIKPGRHRIALTEMQPADPSNPRTQAIEVTVKSDFASFVTFQLAKSEGPQVIEQPLAGH
ncbi:MAG: serine/threonine protein kinase [Acidobacteriota bacterium]